MSNGGRPKAICWQYVKEVGVTNNRKVFECQGVGCGLQKTCSLTTKPQAAGWNDHLVRECTGTNITMAVKFAIARSCGTKKVTAWKEERERQSQNRASVATAEAVSNNRADDDDLDDEPEAKRMRQARLDEVSNFIDHCDDARAAIINDALITFICGCGIAFNIADLMLEDFIEN